MDLRRLQSFPVIAITVVLVLALFGFVLGALSGPGQPRPLTVVEDVPDYVPSPRSGPSREGPIDRAAARPAKEPGPETGKTTQTPPDRVPVVSPRPEIQPGRSDEMVAVPRNEKAEASITVQIEDPEGNPLVFASISLAVNSPGVGWQVLPVTPQQLGQGRFQFSRLFAGEYRVRSENPNYRPAEEVVTLTAGEADRVVRLTLAGAERARVELFIRLEDGTVPQFVTIQMLAGSAQTGMNAGRFGSYGGSVLMAPGTVHSSMARYAPDATTGLIPFTIAVGGETRFVLASNIDNRHFGAETVAKGQPGLQQLDVTLRESDVGRALATDGEPRKLARLELTITLEGGKPVNFTRVNLRQSPGDITYRDFSRHEGSLFVWENIMSGRWWVAVEAREFHAAYLQQVEIGAAEQQTIDITTGRLRVNAAMPAGTPQGSGVMLYNVRLRPQGAGNIERVFKGNLTGKTSDYIDFFIPRGDYTVRLEAPGEGAPFDIEPPQRDLKMTAGAEVALDFAVRAAARVEFQCLNGGGNPVPGVEFLFTTYAAGSVPDSERARVQRGGVDGRCSSHTAPAGTVYLMIWSASTDWNNPDRVYRLELPVYGSKDLGGLVIAP